MKQAVEQNKENYDFDSGPAKDGDFINNNISVDRIKGSYAVQVLRWDLMTFLDAPEASSPLNPKTGQYYVMPPKESFEGLSEADLDYVKKLTERVNRNIHYLGHSPIPRIDPAKMKKGAYVTTGILPLKLLPESYLLSQKFMKANKTTQEEFRTFLGLEDDIDFELAKRLGVPVYHPERFKPENLIKHYRTCWGVPMPMAGDGPLLQPISLGWSYFITWSEYAYKQFYIEYFDAIVESAKLFQKGLEAEKALHTTDAKAAAVQAIVKQAKQYAAKIEKEADKYMHQSDKIYKKPPRSILDPSGSVLNKFLKKQRERSGGKKD